MVEQARGGLGRRGFFGRAGQLLFGAAAVGTTGGGEVAGGAQAQASSTSPQFLIDSHTHCGENENWVSEMVRVYRPRKAMACVLTRMAQMELMRKAMADYPDLFVGYGYVDLDDRNAVREIETFHKNGFIGMKFHSPEKDYDDPGYFEVYRLCEHFRMHMLFHTGICSRKISDTPRLQSPGRMRPMTLDTICRMFPRATVQGAHLGNPWYDEAAEAARWNPNLFFDVTGSTLLKFIKLGRLNRMSEVLWWASDEAVDNPHTLKGGLGAWEHIVFGTDETPAGLEPNIERFQKMMDANQVPQADREKMWGITIAKVLGIDPKSRRLMPREEGSQ